MATTVWDIDPVHSSVEFIVRHMVISKVRGRFSKFAGAVTLDEQDVAKSSVTVKIDVDSIDTREEKRDGHLKSPDFFDAATHPHMEFASKRVEKGSGDHLKVTGDLTLHGVTREVTLDGEITGRAKSPWGKEVLAFSARTTLNRTDFGLKWNQALETGGLLVGEKVEIEIDVEAIRRD
jgi:polyisoprenoid-binding protein YceI